MAVQADAAAFPVAGTDSNVSPNSMKVSLSTRCNRIYACCSLRRQPDIDALSMTEDMLKGRSFGPSRPFSM